MQTETYKSFLSKHRLWSYVIAIGITYILFSPLIIGPYYDGLLFFPDREYRSEIDAQLKKVEDQFNIHKEDVLISMSDKIRIDAWYFKQLGAKKVFLVSHGNGGNVCDRLSLVDTLLKSGSVLVYDYEGYGKSDGKPSRQAICADGLAAYDYLIEKQKVKPKDVILYGESLGCSVCCYISKCRPVGGIILQSGWASLFEAARDRFMLLRLYPLCFFAEPHLDNVAVLSQPHPPVLLIHGRQDNILPWRYSYELFVKACEPKQLVLLPHASHNDVGEVDSSLYLQSILNFLGPSCCR